MKLMFLKVLMLIRLKLLRSIIFVTITSFRQRVEVQPTISNSCHDVSILSFNINSITISNLHDVNFGCIIFGISINEAIYINIKKFCFEKKTGSF